MEETDDRGRKTRTTEGHPEVVDADLADYFGSIPHAELLKSVTRRIVDRRVARDNRRGIPQGSPISPLLANLYMRRFVLGMEEARA